MTATKEDGPSERTGVVAFGWAAYRQVAAILGAFALAAFIGNYVELDWRSFLGTLFGLWEETVRPAVKWVLDLLISTPLSWLGLHVEVPVLVRDYLSVTAILALSVIRADYFQVRPVEEADTGVVKIAGYIGSYGFLFALNLLWPLLALYLVLNLVLGSFRPRSKTLLALMPMLYLGLLLVVNAFIH
jgi:hypothetical protein